MNSITSAQLATPFHCVERQNRILLLMLCAIIGLAFLGATKGGNVITADEVRTHRLSLINEKGNVVHEWVARQLACRAIVTIAFIAIDERKP